VSTSQWRETLDALWRIESANLIAGLARIVRDVGVAEELAQDTCVLAIEKWSESGVPENPGAWLMTAARYRAIDVVRRQSRWERTHETLSREFEVRGEVDDCDPCSSLDEEVDDDILRLMFIACHPVLSTAARVALTLRRIGGLKTEEIARSFLVTESTIAQRIVRAKRSLAEARVPFELPRKSELAVGLSSVLEVIYLIFNEGYSATAGDVWIRPELCEDAMRLGRILAGLQPTDPEVHGLLALMELHASRSRARIGVAGEPILLAEQDRSRWDQLLIRRGLAALRRARALGGAPGAYALQAAIAARHARAISVRETDWVQIVTFYDLLLRLQPSPVVKLNRAVAVSMAFGPATGLELLDAIHLEESIEGYHVLPSARGDLLARLERFEEARVEFERAAHLTQNTRERTLLLNRAVHVRSSSHP
jgi:RNA polymerase sigma factor (sigma-70 family)